MVFLPVARAYGHIGPYFSLFSGSGCRGEYLSGRSVWLGAPQGPPPESPVSIALDRTDPEFWRLRRADLCLSPRVLAIPGEE